MEQKIVYLSNLRDTNGKLLTIYAWFHRTAEFDAVEGLLENDVIEFTAGVDHLPAQTPTFGCQLQSPMSVRKLGFTSTSVNRRGGA